MVVRLLLAAGVVVLTSLPTHGVDLETKRTLGQKLENTLEILYDKLKNTDPHPVEEVQKSKENMLSNLKQGFSFSTFHGLVENALNMFRKSGMAESIAKTYGTKELDALEDSWASLQEVLHRLQVPKVEDENHKSENGMDEKFESPFS